MTLKREISVETNPVKLILDAIKVSSKSIEGFISTSRPIFFESGTQPIESIKITINSKGIDSYEFIKINGSRSVVLHGSCEIPEYTLISSVKELIKQELNEAKSIIDSITKTKEVDELEI